MMASQSKTIMWFRRDLRIEDNPAFLTASKEGVVLPVFIWCPSEEGQFYPGRCSRWWLKQSLAHLDQALKSIGAPLVCIWAESSISALLRWISTIGATKVVYNHLYGNVLYTTSDPISLIRDHAVKSQLMDHGIIVQSFNGNLLYEPWEVYDESGNAFTTFEEFWNKCLSLPAESVSFFPPWKLVPPTGIESVENCSVEELGLEKESEKSSNALLSRGWSPGWSNADKILSKFLRENLLNYSKNRMRLEESTTSLLSPYLHFGEVSVRKVFQNVRMLQIQWKKEGTFVAAESANFFLRSIGLREYSRYLCFNFPFTHERSLLGNLKHYPWRADQEQFKAWRQGRTGYPLVDAGMRELWATGWIHNRIRVIVASFFVKFLQLPWTWGLKYFWDTLLDADLESDILGWQYISGSLPDGHELTRLDNPEEQGQRFDPEGEYIRNWIPELARMPTQFIHHPWDAPTTVLKAAGIELGSNYPKPIVEINAAMERLVDAVSMMWESDRAARDARFNSTGEVFADNHTMKSFYIPNVVVKKEALELASSLDQRVPSILDVVISPAVRKEVKLDDDLRSTAESSSAKKRSIRERHISVPSSCSSVIDSGSQCEDDMFKPNFLAGSPSSEPAEKDEEGGAESTKNGLRPCKRPA